MDITRASGALGAGSIPAGGTEAKGLQFHKFEGFLEQDSNHYPCSPDAVFSNSNPYYIL